MHMQKIVHRDLKPENILLVSEPDLSGEIFIKLTDFGLATHLPKGIKLDQQLGSPIYMSPEVMNEESYD